MRVIELLYPSDSKRLRPGLSTTKPCPCCNGGRGPCSHGKSTCGTCQGKGTVPIEHKEKDNDCGAEIKEATLVAPLTKDAADKLRELFKAGLVVDDAELALTDIIHDDALNQEFQIAVPGTNALPIIHKWIELNMPDLLVPDDRDEMGAAQGIFSVLHGYDTDDQGQSEDFISNYTK